MSAFPNIAIRHLFSIGSGATPESGNPDYWDGDIFWVTPEDVSAAKDGKIVGTKRRITDDGLRSCSARLSPPETVVLTKRAPIGQLAVAEVELCSNQGCFLLEPGSGVDPQFYFHWLNANNAYLKTLGRGSTFMELSTDELKSLRVPYPPIHVQNSIAKFLNENAAQIDTLIEAKQKLLGLLAEKRRTLVAEVVMRGLDRSAPLRPSGIDWLGDIPEHWASVPLRFLVSFMGGATPDTKKEEYWNGKIPWVSPKDMKRDFITDAEDHVSEQALANSALKMIDEGAVLIVVRGMILAHSFPTAINTVPVTINQDMKALRCDERISPRFLKAVLEGATQYLVDQADSSAHGTKKLETGVLGALGIPVPPLDEQELIVAHIAEERVKIDKLATATERSITLLKERRSALIAAAVTGQIAIPEAA